MLRASHVKVKLAPGERRSTEDGPAGPGLGHSQGH